MGRALSDIIRDTDEILTRRSAGAEKSASEEALGDEDIFKLAEQIKRPPEAPAAVKQAEDKDVDFTLREKVAHAIALVDTLFNLPTLTKVAEFEDRARAGGYSDAEISAQLEKTAGIKFRSILDEMPWLEKES